jgi:hypothetical protein
MIETEKTRGGTKREVKPDRLNRVQSSEKLKEEKNLGKSHSKPILEVKMI